MVQNLPISPYLGEIENLIKTNARVILTATPGAGKTTALPAHLLKAKLGKIAILQPRRLAAIAAAQFVSESLGLKLGEEVGYQVRGDSRVSAKTQLVFMTDALFLRKMVQEPELKEFGLVVLDEFHERNLNQDLVLGLVKELQDMGSEVKLLVMSATLNIEELQRYLASAAIIDIPGQIHPLEIHNTKESFSLQTDYKFIERVSKTILDHDADTSGDILVFLPGLSEMSRVHQELLKARPQKEIFFLHGSLSLQDQKQILTPSAHRRIILSTNIAEASVTVPGVRTVIDSGLARVNRMSYQSGFSRLDLNRISQFSAKQRAGRAAREAAGVCIRLWNEYEDSSMEQQLPPECQRVDLSQALLTLTQLGIHDFANFSWFSKPSRAGLEVAMRFLQSIGAIELTGRITKLGEKVLFYPTEPRWGVLLEAGRSHQCFLESAAAVAILDERDFLNAPTHEAGLESDLNLRMKHLFDQEEKNVHFSRRQRIRDNFKQIAEKTRFDFDDVNQKNFNMALIESQSDRLARRRGQSSRALMANGRGIKLAPDSLVKNSEYFIALSGVDQAKQSETAVQWAHAVSLEEIRQALGEKIIPRTLLEFDETKRQFYQKQFQSFGALEIGAVTKSPASPDAVAEHLPEVIFTQWNSFVLENKALEKWWQRWQHFIEAFEAYSDRLAESNLFKVLQQACYQKSKIEEVINAELISFLEMSLDRHTLQTFKKEAPSHFIAPSEGKHPIQYSATEAPFVEVRIQEVFGLQDHPKVLGKPLIVKLLSPGFRPVQITSDIGSFWKTSYLEVKKEMKGRYPKHAWPDDPLQALPVIKGQHRRKN